jgi:hypothetical protein
MAQAMDRLLATPKTIPVFPCSNGMLAPFKEPDHSKAVSRYPIGMRTMALLLILSVMPA